MIWKKEPTMECPRCGEISFEHTDTLVGQGQRTLEFACDNCGEHGYFDENPKRDGLRLKMTEVKRDPASGGKARPANPIMKYARGYFDG